MPRVTSSKVAAFAISFSKEQFISIISLQQYQLLNKNVLQKLFCVYAPATFSSFSPKYHRLRMTAFVAVHWQLGGRERTGNFQLEFLLIFGVSSYEVFRCLPKYYKYLSSVFLTSYFLHFTKNYYCNRAGRMPFHFYIAAFKHEQVSSGSFVLKCHLIPCKTEEMAPCSFQPEPELQDFQKS